MTQPKDSQSGRGARVTFADLFDCKVRMVYNRMISRRLKPGAETSVCLPCYQIRDWDRAKEVIDKLIPDGWSSRWGEKKGVLILSNVKITHGPDASDNPKP